MVVCEGSEFLKLARPPPRIIDRHKLRRRLLESMEVYALTLIIAPPVSGKAILIGQLAADLRIKGDIVAEGLDECPDAQVTVVRGFEGLTDAAASATASEIERRVADGRRVIVSADRPFDTAFPLARLRNQVQTFRLKDLALRQDELAVFLGADLGDSKTERELRALFDAVGGWIGAWNIIKAQAEQGRTLSEIRTAFSGAAPELRGYFDQLILPGLEPEVREFILEVGMLDRISPELADTITGRSDGLRLLERASAQCAFIETATDGVWRRPAKLLRDYVRHCAKRDTPGALRAGLVRAAEWAATREDWLYAAQLFAEADAAERAVDILVRHTDDLITAQGEVLSYRQLATGLTNDLRYSRSLAAELALGSIFAGDFAQAARLLESLEPLIGGLPASRKARLEAISICIDFGLERFERVTMLAPRWLDQHPAVEPRFRAIAAVSLFWSCLAQLDGPGAHRALAIARAATSKADARFLDAWLVICNATLRWELGQVEAADSLLSGATASGVIDHTMNLIRAAVAWEQGDEPRARQLTAASLRQGAKHSVVETAYLGWTTAARIAIQDGGLERGLKLLQEAETTMASRHGERARRLVRLFRAKLLMQAADDGGAAQLGSELEAISSDSPTLGHARSLEEAARITVARWRTLQGHPRAAISLLQPIVSAALQQGRLRAWGEASLIYAGALARLDEVERATRMAWYCIEQLAAGGSGASVWDEHILLAPILDDLLARARIENPWKSHLHTVFGVLAARAGRGWDISDAAEDFVRELPATVGLTEMERRILMLVGQGRSNAELAEHLLVQVSTVKWHLHNVFGKLDVRSRTAALAEARRQGLVA